jgi:hypothetical protein
METLDDNVEAAESEMTNVCDSIGCAAWPVKVDGFPYTIGITTSWMVGSTEEEREQQSENLKYETATIRDAVTKVASRYGVEGLFNGPCIGAGGAFVLYVGFRTEHSVD